MSRLALIFAFIGASIGQALAWGQEGHSIVAEIAQRRLSPSAVEMVAKVLGSHHSLASVASWADDARDERPETAGWHFVDIPINVPKYKLERDCKNGDCVIAELDRLKDEIRCAGDESKADALKFAVHFLGDIHQPLHTVKELTGGNDIKVDIFMRGMTCTAKCEPEHKASNFHAAWDADLIEKTTWDWGAFVDRLEKEWLASPEAHRVGIDGGDPVAWAEETHKAARTVWMLRPADNVLDDRYFRDILPILDRQLSVAGLRLAKFLNDASDRCPVP